MFKKKPKTVLVTKVFIGGQFVAETVKVIEPGPDWIRRIALAAVIPWGLWAMTTGGMFR